MPTELKAKTIDELSAKLRDSKSSVVLDYRGLTVAQITDLRRQLGAENVEFQVAKNTLVRIAAERAQVDVAAELLIGPTALAFSWGDEVSPAKLLTAYTRRNREVSIKGGILGGRSLNAEQVGRVAELPSREVMLSQLLGVIQAPLAKMLGVAQAPAREVAGLALALSSKQGETADSAPA